MEKFNFSNEGFQDLQKHLYAQEDQAIETEASYLLADFRKWIKKKFMFNDEQIAFIDSQNLTMIKLLSVQTYVAISNRLPISLNKPATKPHTQQLDSKLIRPENNFTTLLNSNGNAEISGNLIIHISYTTKNKLDYIPHVLQKTNQQYL